MTVRIPLSLPISLVALLSACSGGGGTSGSDGGSGPVSDPDGPRITELRVNTNAVGPSDALVVTAVVTDPQGVADISGGSLNLSGTQLSFGAFREDAESGVYALTLSFAELLTTSPNDVLPGAELNLGLRARFFDQAGNVGEADTSVALACDAPEEGTCGGQCIDLLSDRENCGSCNLTCEDELPGTNIVDSCTAGRCGGRYGASPDQSCDQVCGANGLVCGTKARWQSCEEDAIACAYYNNGPSDAGIAHADCSTPPSSIEPFGAPFALQCYCELP